MKKFVFWRIFVAALLMASNSQAQSLKDLFNKENIEKVVNSVTGKSTASMEGTWVYTGSAIEWASQPDKCLLLLMQTALSPPKSVRNP